MYRALLPKFLDRVLGLWGRCYFHLPSSLGSILPESSTPKALSLCAAPSDQLRGCQLSTQLL